MKSRNTLFRARVDSVRLNQAKDVFERLGLKPSDAVNMFFAQVVLRDDLPFSVTAHPERLLADEAQAQAWNDAFGEY